MYKRQAQYIDTLGSKDSALKIQQAKLAQVARRTLRNEAQIETLDARWANLKALTILLLPLLPEDDRKKELVILKEDLGNTPKQPSINVANGPLYQSFEESTAGRVGRGLGWL